MCPSLHRHPPRPLPFLQLYSKIKKRIAVLHFKARLMRDVHSAIVWLPETYRAQTYATAGTFENFVALCGAGRREVPHKQGPPGQFRGIAPAILQQRWGHGLVAGAGAAAASAQGPRGPGHPARCIQDHTDIMQARTDALPRAFEAG